jgi:hypothetical protein
MFFTGTAVGSFPKHFAHNRVYPFKHFAKSAAAIRAILQLPFIAASPYFTHAAVAEALTLGEADITIYCFRQKFHCKKTPLFLGQLFPRLIAVSLLANV